MPFREAMFVASGGAIGSVLRYGVSLLLASPWGTLAVNVVGCFAIGVASELVGPTRLLLVTGILGGFTTFSAFGNETFAFLRAGDTRGAALNVVANVLLGLLAVALGRWLAASTAHSTP